MALAVTTTGAAPEPCDGTVQLISQSSFQDDKALFSDLICAGLGRKEEALRLGRRACERVPISKDAKDGIDLAIKLAQIYAWTGEKDLAIEQIEMIQRVPNPLSYRLYSNSIPTGIRSAAIRASNKTSPRSRRNSSPGCSRFAWSLALHRIAICRALSLPSLSLQRGAKFREGMGNSLTMKGN